ncbi:uncharacterized protein LOC102810381 [Saccoglossus kowalevskii]|uniref:Lysine-rich nucleolar protein 1-like n=1 Tax=Saccoglossus kowalevskii TaxID=10224 RepID=A0ABM0M3Z6_SACKO|nr:PREDICTED: lysine-rich nucleolar protein 1-like [Saccoglossus kowalevskii]
MTKKNKKNLDSISSSKESLNEDGTKRKRKHERNDTVAMETSKKDDEYDNSFRSSSKKKKKRKERGEEMKIIGVIQKENKNISDLGSQDLVSEASISSKKKKKKQMDEDVSKKAVNSDKKSKKLTTQDHADLGNEESGNEQKKSRKKKKRKSSKDDTNNTIQNDVESQNIGEKKQDKKSKKNKHLQEVFAEDGSVNDSSACHDMVEESKKSKRKTEKDKKSSEKRKRKQDQNEDLKLSQIDAEDIHSGTLCKKRKKKKREKMSEEERIGKQQKNEKKNYQGCDQVEMNTKKRKYDPGDGDDNAFQKNACVMATEEKREVEKILNPKKKKKKSKHKDEPEVDQLKIRAPNNTDEKLKKNKNDAIKSETVENSLNGKDNKMKSNTSMGQWSSATFDTSQQQNKFFRLMGGMKNQPSTKDPQNATSRSNFALNKTMATKMNEKLEKQFEVAMEKKWDIKKGFGLGYSAPESVNKSKKFYIDKNAVKSFKFED